MCAPCNIKLVWIAVFSLLSAVIFQQVFPVFLDLTNSKTLEISKCPACYGVTLCPSFLTGEITLDSWYQLTTKNVFMAQYRWNKVVLKKLGYEDELERSDDHVRGMCGLHNETDVAVAIQHFTHKHLQKVFVPDAAGLSGHYALHLKISDKITRDYNGERILPGSEVLACPSQRKWELIESRAVQNNLGINPLTIMYNVMTILLVNSEPLLFQMFPAQESWPFPYYLGACGRFIVEEYVGPSLWSWLPAVSWRQKLSAALQLLQIAERLTKGASGFRLYLTDLSLYNVAVDPNGQLKVIDAENIIITDLEAIQKDKPMNFDVPYVSFNGGCDNMLSDNDCVSYIEEDLCNRLYNDHNFYVVCHELFNPADNFGLLNGLPEIIQETHHNLPQLQKECYIPSESGNRTESAKALISIYSKILSSL